MFAPSLAANEGRDEGCTENYTDWTNWFRVMVLKKMCMQVQHRNPQRQQGASQQSPLAGAAGYNAANSCTAI
ncbi:MAG TPA: hypothetical protein VGY66_23905 [Gemmataceae bacterium]|jgi:hypothetical protein|nr:hypothetical protein [Gemmataceae bacterium]